MYQNEILCYEAGVDAIRHVIDLRKNKDKGQFERLDEDKKVPFVVPKVTWDSTMMAGSLNNEHWAFNVHYAFREALDLRFMERVRNKRKVHLWTQGALVSFKEGDTLVSRCRSRSVQVKYANGMGWDAAKQEMYFGSVIFKKHTIKNGVFSFVGEDNLTQLEFLEMLITGSIGDKKNDRI